MSKTIKITTTDLRDNPVILLIKPGRYLECGGCGNYHHESFYGDCRDDDERFYFFQLEGPDGLPVSRRIEIVPLEEVSADIW